MRKKKQPQPLMKKKNIHENPKIVFLKEGLEKPEEGQQPRLEKDCQFEGRRRSDSLDQHFPVRSSYQRRKNKAAKPTKMPAKLVYSWEKSEPIPMDSRKRKTTQQHYPVVKIRKEGK